MRGVTFDFCYCSTFFEGFSPILNLSSWQRFFIKLTMSIQLTPCSADFAFSFVRKKGYNSTITPSIKTLFSSVNRSELILVE